MPTKTATNTLNDSRCVWKEASDKGPRESNQDHALSIAPSENNLIRQKGVLMVVCDGVGNDRAGQRAAEIAANATLDAFYTSSQPDMQKALLDAIENAHAAVQAEANLRKFNNSATTLVASVVHNKKLYVAHVGNSRAYVWREGRLKKVTQDHEQNDALTRSLGSTKHNADITLRELRWGDRVLLCSDGLTDAVNDTEIEKILSMHSSPERAVNALMRAAETKIKDNISVSVLNHGEVKATATYIPWRLIGMGTAALVGVLLAGWLIWSAIRGGTDDVTVNNEPAIATAAPVAEQPKPTAANANTGGIRPQTPTDTPQPAPAADTSNQNNNTTQNTPQVQATPTLLRAPTATPRKKGETSPNTNTAASNGAPPSFLDNATTSPAGNSSGSTSTDNVLTANGFDVFANNRFSIQVVSTGFEQWGDPQVGGRCDGFFDAVAVNQFKLTVRVANPSTNELRGLVPQFFTRSGLRLPTCHDGGGALPTVPAGETRVVRLLGYLYKDQEVATLTLTSDGLTERVCFTANKLVRC